MRVGGGFVLNFLPPSLSFCQPPPSLAPSASRRGASSASRAPTPPSPQMRTSEWGFRYAATPPPSCCRRPLSMPCRCPRPSPCSVPAPRRPSMLCRRPPPSSCRVPAASPRCVAALPLPLHAVPPPPLPTPFSILPARPNASGVGCLLDDLLLGPFPFPSFI
ncbi:hypothetical protein DFH94DRAFT_704636 [Russula ochroleuca]|uniref:Uncharacterized protein n=1 Tax=Russula ochroleuca TaxID=152965 RepID=A0A9P5N6Q8_9AGAM|nr:hypothetical protein DFH94DRAFT_704636 [Russula ochroleuca]